MKLRLSKLAWASLVGALGVPSAGGAQDDDPVLREAQPSFPTATSNGSGGGSSITEGAEFLLLPTGARAVGMGGAVTAMRGSGESVIWNPAGVASIEGKRFFFSHNESAFDTRTDVVALLWPIESIGNVGVTYYLVDFGDITNTDERGAVRGNITFRNQEFLLTYSNRVIGGLEAGISYKLIQMVFRCDGSCPEQRSFTQTTHAVDLGLIYSNLAGLPLALGGSVRHLGFALQGESEDDPLPTRIRFGVSYEALSRILQDSTFALALAVDVEDRVRDLGDPSVMIGSEFGIAERFFLRAGYAFVNAGNGGAALGLGLTHDWFYLDLSRGFDDISSATGEESVQITLGLMF